MKVSCKGMSNKFVAVVLATAFFKVNKLDAGSKCEDVVVSYVIVFVVVLAKRALRHATEVATRQRVSSLFLRAPAEERKLGPEQADEGSRRPTDETH